MKLVKKSVVFNLLSLFGKAFIPKSLQGSIKDYLLKAGIKSDPFSFFGSLFFLSIILTSFIYLASVYGWLINFNNLFLFFIGSFIAFFLIAMLIISAVMTIIYFYLDLIIYQRTTAIEVILPDYLQLVSTNVKSGMSFEKSLWFAIKPRFGILGAEMEMVLKRVMTGHDLGDAIMEFANKYDSPMLRRTMSLMVGELESGGKISHIIDDLVINLKNNQKLKAEMAASVITYMIFIGAIVIFISPALFALSYHLLRFMDQFINKIASSDASVSTIPIPFKSGVINVEEFRQFSLIAVIIVSVLSSVIVSIIEKGNIKGGIKYIPIFVAGSVFCYFMFMIILDAVFGGIIV